MPPVLAPSPTSYAKWLRDKTQVRQLTNWVEITTPYLDRHNDYIQIYASKPPTAPAVRSGRFW